jgi:hydroxypyruvate isomerase
MSADQPAARNEAFLQAPLSRRGAFKLAAGSALAATSAVAFSQLAHAEPKSAEVEKAATKGRIKQSIVHWCFKEHWDLEQTAKIGAQLGCQSVELVGPEHWPTLKKHGLVCAIAGSHGFVKGMNNPAHHEECLALLRKRIDECAEFSFPSVISFTGMSGDISSDEGATNCVAGFKKIVGHAEKQGVTICLEMLNSRVSDHPMKGHPGYQGDHTDYCIDIIKQVGSPRLKLLFDIYHVQIMDGDVIARIRQHAEHIGHVHTAGNPGRGELDNLQEINYPPIMQALVDVKYDGYVGQEFIPTRDPLVGLFEAVRLCDV